MLKLFGYALKYNHKIGCHLSTVTCRKMSVAASKSINKRPKKATNMGERKPKLYVNSTFDITDMKTFALLEEKCEVVKWPSVEGPSGDEILSMIKGVDAILLYPPQLIDKRLLEVAGPQLKVIGSSSVGFNHIDLDACRAAGVKVGNTPGVLDDCVAELTISLVLATARKICSGMQQIKDGKWCRNSYLWLPGKDIQGTTVGIVGLGRIGTAIAKRLQAFDIERLVYYSRHPSPHAPSVNAEYVNFKTLLRVSDYVVVCCAYNEDSKEMFDKEAFGLMKNDAVFVNVSRGGLVNQDDLYNALVSGEIWGAGLDVTTPEPLPTDSPLLTLENCTIVPHIGSATRRTRHRMCELTCRNILAALNGEDMPSPLC